MEQVIGLDELQRFDHIGVLACGSSVARVLKIPAHNTLENIFSAKDFIG
jgi:hypothetical protein